jgi:hypothetical protein
MQLLDWSYTKKYSIKAVFQPFSHSTVIFRQIKDYYFVYTVHWSSRDPIVTRNDLETMEILMNKALGTDQAYFRRSAYRPALLQERRDCNGRPL